MVPERRPVVSEIDERIVDAIGGAPMPVTNTGYLTAALGEPEAVVIERLEHLVEEGVVEHMEIRGRGHLWWLALPYEPRA